MSDRPAEPEGPKVYRQGRFRPAAGATEILLVRHGESQPLVAGQPFPLTGGHGDPPLHTVGQRQAEQLADRLVTVPIDAIYVTTLRRTHETAAPLAARLGLTPQVEPDLREVHLGEWEGELYRQKMADRDPVAVRMWTEQRWDVIPGAEPADRLRARVKAGIDRIAAAHRDQRVVVVAHGGVIAEALAIASATPHPFAFLGVNNASISHLVVQEDRWVIRRFNDTAHLDLDLDVDLGSLDDA